MKTKILFIQLLLFQLAVFAQNKGTINYGQLESMGMGSPIGQDYSSVLLFNSTKSLYIVRNDSLEKQHIHKQERTETGSDVYVTTKATNKYGLRYFVDLKKDSLFSRDIGFTYVKEKKPEIDWKIKNETKKIGRYECRKAEAEFRGRNYTGWFTTEIPLPFGPWKLQGLPGLILEAYDTKKEVYFYFKKIKYPSETNVKIEEPIKQPEQSSKKWVDLEEYKRLRIQAHIRAVNNGLMFSENTDTSVIQENVKYNLKDSYIENFEIKTSIKD